jgi:hypothetical protein
MIPISIFGKALNILVTLDDYDANFALENQYENVTLTAFVLFAGLWVFQLASYLFYSTLGGEIFGPYRHRVVFGRHTMDTLAMVSMSYMGYESLANFGGFEAIPSLLLPNGNIAAVGAERAYIFSAAAQRLCTLQVAYEMKNFCDSVIHNDGPIFLAHHAVTGLLSFLCLKPFLHVYCSFFLGWSEFSTAILCILVLFDAERGIPPLAKACPNLMKFTGVAFAITFTIFRVILWPYVNYYFWQDMHHMWSNGTMHSEWQAYIFLAVNAGLTLLQMVWLGEIVQTGMKMFDSEGGGEMSIKRGDDGSSSNAETKKVESKKKR